jgi:chromosome segregation ATPase
MENKQDEGVHQEYEEFMKKTGVPGFNEYSLHNRTQHYSHVPEDMQEGYQAKMTLLSRNAKKTMTTSKTGDLSFVNEADFSKIKPKLAESEFKENSIVKGLEDSNNSLKEQLLDLADKKDELERENKRLKRELEDMEMDMTNQDKWRKRYKAAEEGLRDAEERLGQQERENRRLNAQLEELEKQVGTSKEELQGLLQELRRNSAEGGRNKDLLREVFKKVDELSKKSKC